MYSSHQWSIYYPLVCQVLDFNLEISSSLAVALLSLIDSNSQPPGGGADPMIFPPPLPPTPPVGGNTIPDNIPGAGNCAIVSTLPSLGSSVSMFRFSGLSGSKMNTLYTVSKGHIYY